MGYKTKTWMLSILAVIVSYTFLFLIYFASNEQEKISVHGENGDEMRPLHDAVLERDLNEVKKLISLGADVNAKNERWGKTPMHYAATWSIVEVLLNEGADINSVKELLGHSSLSATQVYSHTSMERIKEVFKDTHPRAK